MPTSFPEVPSHITSSHRPPKMQRHTPAYRGHAPRCPASRFKLHVPIIPPYWSHTQSVLTHWHKVNILPHGHSTVNRAYTPRSHRLAASALNFVRHCCLSSYPAAHVYCRHTSACHHLNTLPPHIAPCRHRASDCGIGNKAPMKFMLCECCKLRSLFPANMLSVGLGCTHQTKRYPTPNEWLLACRPVVSTKAPLLLDWRHICMVK